MLPNNSLSQRRIELMDKDGISVSEFLDRVKSKDKALFYRKKKVLSLESPQLFYILELKITDGHLLLEAKTNISYFISVFDFYAKNTMTGELHKGTVVENSANNTVDGNRTIYYDYSIFMSLPINDGVQYKFVIISKKYHIRYPVYPDFGYYGKFDRESEKSYFKDGEWLLHYKKAKITINRSTVVRSIKSEWDYINELKKRNIPDFKEIVKLRLMAKMISFFKSKEWWIISDRAYLAGDNGQALFQFLQQKHDRSIRSFFLISKHSNDYDEIVSIGKTIDLSSFKNKLYYMICDKLISSSADNWLFNVFGDTLPYVKSFISFDYCFLQHGVTVKNFAKWLHRTKKNIKMLASASTMEYKAFLEGGYGYSEDVVKLTGFARFDLLEDRSERLISIMPTWRKDIAANHVALTEDDHVMVRGYSNSFVDTDYYKFYQGLIDDGRLHELLQKYDYRCVLYMHPSFAKQACDFKSHNERITVYHDIKIDYKDVFARSKILITDYSSVATDLAYMKKPIIYTQFDRERFLEKHTGKEGYFNYDEMGFGPVCKTCQETVKELESIIKHGSKMESKYEKRRDSFFAYDDKRNSERIYKEIKAIGKQH